MTLRMTRRPINCLSLTDGTHEYSHTTSHRSRTAKRPLQYLASQASQLTRKELRRRVLPTTFPVSQLTLPAGACLLATGLTTAPSNSTSPRLPTVKPQRAFTVSLTSTQEP